MKKLAFLITILPLLGIAQNKVTSQFVDSIANVSLEKFPQAGFAIAVIQNGEVSHLKGYGIADIKSKAPVDENTLFGIASNSKAFTATALGMLADQGKLNWTDRVVDHIPEFKMYDDYITANFTILDLLTHRSGLGLGAGDLMFFPEGGDYTINDVLKSFQYQEVKSDFRTKYDYDNLLFIVAGEVIKRISGKDWADFVETEIMQPLEMNNSKGIYQNIKGNNNVATPHKIENNEVIPVYSHEKNGTLFAAAGGIYSSVFDMSHWVKLHLNQGIYGNDSSVLISAKNHRELWKSHTVISSSPYGRGDYNNHYSAYGLGFFVKDQNGYSVINHSGGLPGMLSMVTLVPELNAGIIVLTNSAPGGLGLVTLTNEIKDEIIGVNGQDWIGWAEKRLAGSNNETDSVVTAVWEKVEKSKKVKLNFDDYLGKYKDNWFGEIEVYQQDKELWFKSLRSPSLTGKMSYYQANSFAIKWNYQDMNCDAFAMFQLDENGKATGIKMKGIDPHIDFSFDFHDLDLKRVK